MGSPKKVEFASTHLDPIDSEAPAAYGGGSAMSGGGSDAPGEQCVGYRDRCVCDCVLCVCVLLNLSGSRMGGAFIRMICLFARNGGFCSIAAGCRGVPLLPAAPWRNPAICCCGTVLPMQFIDWEIHCFDRTLADA